MLLQKELGPGIPGTDREVQHRNISVSERMAAF